MDEALLLIEPSIEFKEEFFKMVLQYKEHGESYYFDMYKESLIDFNKYILKLKKDSNSFNPCKCFIPCVSYWLINESKEVLGSIRIRSNLNSRLLKDILGNIGYDISPLNRGKGYGKVLLKLGLEKAKELNINPVLITCFSYNHASRKVIESNGGIFHSEIVDKYSNDKIRRYWIHID